MEKYLREQFLLEEEMHEKLAAPFAFVHLKTAQQNMAVQPMDAQAPPEQVGGMAPPTAPGQAPVQVPDPKRAALEQVLSNLQKSPVVELFSKQPPQAPEEEPMSPTAGNPQQGMPKVAAKGVLKIKFPQTALPKLKKTPAGAKTTSAKTLKPTLQTKYSPPKLPESKLPKALTPPPKDASKVEMNRKVKAIDILKDKLGDA